MINKEFTEYAIALAVVGGVIIGPFALREYEKQQLETRERALERCYITGITDGIDIAGRFITSLGNENTGATKILLRESISKRFNRPPGQACNGD